MKNLIFGALVMAVIFAGCAGEKGANLETGNAEKTTKILPAASAKKNDVNLNGQEYFDKFLAALDKKDYAAAKKNVDKACELGHAEACYADGQLHLRAGNLDASKVCFERACAAGHKFACAQLGIVLINLGQTAAGLAAMNRACDMGDGLACGNLGGIYSGKHPKIKPDAALSKSYYTKACKLGIEQTRAKVDFCELAK